jgi:hypothetical protein
MRPNQEFGGQLMSKIKVTEHFEIEGVAKNEKKLSQSSLSNVPSVAPKVIQQRLISKKPNRPLQFLEAVLWAKKL